MPFQGIHHTSHLQVCLHDTSRMNAPVLRIKGYISFSHFVGDPCSPLAFPACFGTITITASKSQSVLTSNFPLRIRCFRLSEILNREGNSTSRGSGDHQRMGEFLSYHGKIPWEYAVISDSILRSPPAASRPSASAVLGSGNWYSNDIKVPRTRLELAHRNRRQPLKLACLPISPPGHGIVPRTGLEPAHPYGY